MAEPSEWAPALNEQVFRLLIQAPKIIESRNPAIGYLEETIQRRCELRLRSSDGSGQAFSVFIRQNIRFARNFSVGLRYTPSANRPAAITLVRYNGPHGETSRTPGGHHTQPHIHYLTAADLAAGHTQPTEQRREITTRYQTLEEALPVFFTDTAILNYRDYFPG